MFNFKCCAIKLAFFSLITATAYAQIPAIYTTPSTFHLPPLQNAIRIKPLDSDAVIEFTVWLKLRNKKQLDQFVSELYQPSSPNYQKFLASGQFNNLYAPSPAVENAVLYYFLAQGMQARIVNHSVRVTATAQQIEKTFNVKMNYYRNQNKMVYANASIPALRSDIAQHVLDITGLNNIAQYQPALRGRPIAAKQNVYVKPHDLNLKWNSFTPFAQPTTTSFAGFTGSQLQTALKLASIAPIRGTTINGAGQTLVIIDACGHHTAAEIMSDANLYNASNNITLLSASNFTVINPDGTPFTTCAHPNNSWDDEIALDVESSHTLAPGANTVLVLAQSDAAPLDTAVSDVINTLINNNFTIGGFSNAYVVSNSWGLAETSGSSPAMETTLETAAAHAISFNFSTGDCGDGTYNSSWPCTSTGVTPSVEYPASSAYTTAVGGTSIFVDNNWNYAFEGLWGSYYDGAFYAGTTGGISQFYGPVTWQNAISNFSAGGYNMTVGSYNTRAVPDVAMVADPYTGLTIYVRGSTLVYGGTSLACPLFSATLTLVNQARTLLNGGTARPIGQAAPYLYSNNAALLHAQGINLITPPHSIISGALLPPNGAPLSAFKVPDTFYGYDLTFGWDSTMSIEPENQFWNDGVGVGSPNLPNFIPLMAQF